MAIKDMKELEEHLDKQIKEHNEVVHERETGKYYPGARHDTAMIERLKENVLRFTSLRNWLKKKHDA